MCLCLCLCLCATENQALRILWCRLTFCIPYVILHLLIFLVVVIDICQCRKLVTDFCENLHKRVSQYSLQSQVVITKKAVTNFWTNRKGFNFPPDWFGTLTCPLFHCFGTPIWPPWRHEKMLYSSLPCHFKCLGFFVCLFVFLVFE